MTGDATCDAVGRAACDAGIALRELRLDGVTLEQAYLKLVSEGASERGRDE